ncbi:DNA ligase D [Chryseosolibacter indicus]|uniref:DNA ligase (ATP) n=1 Tax=Chryseosolibacter indicus TaxID=2782351 RepID=A0ABS5VNX8_9BACT|nr:DNA ligase D [Chryseosolibacter indicus]MBT1702554.1 DNA ligase D [Chryseosolibacter indicus]
MATATSKKRKVTASKAPQALKPIVDKQKNENNVDNKRMRSVRSSGKEKLTSYIKPMLATLHDKPFDDDKWIFEIKWDGYRAIAEASKQGAVKLYSRNGLSFLKLYPKIADAISSIKEDVVFDGEIVVFNEDNKPDFQKLQQYDMHRSLPILYYVFDCLSYQGKSIKHLPLIERKKIAQSIIPKGSIIRYSDHVEGEGNSFFEHVLKMNLEGMIAKRADGTYLEGKRSKDWLKIKNHNTQEAIIAGYTAPRGSRTLIGALVLAIKAGGKLKYVGHTGTGFTTDILKELYKKLQPLKRLKSPFDYKIPVNGQVTWVEPELVCAIKFSEITEDGILRHPVYQGLRIDKSADETTSIDAPIHVENSIKDNTAKKNQKQKSETIKINGHELTITNKQKVYWPSEKITKGDVINYYNSIHKYILPYLKDRPESLRRNPNGIKDEGFFQKDAGDSIPNWIKTSAIEAESAHKMVDYIICNDLATLLYLNNLGCIELNPWNSRLNKLDHPDYMVLDLDPSEENTFDQVIETAQVVHDILEKAGAQSYCKTSGASGLHIYIPLHAAYTYEEIRAFAEIIARLTEEKLPKTTTVERALNKRNGKLYLDYLQNKKGQTLAAVYSVRPKPGAIVSTPLLWKEVKPGLHPSQFHIFNIQERLQTHGDLFASVLKDKINVKKCLKNLGI